MAKLKETTMQVINRTTGISGSANGARGSYLVARKGSKDGARWGNRKQKYRDIRAALGLSAG